MEIKIENGIEFLCGSWPLNNSKPTLIFISGAGMNFNLWKSQVGAFNDSANAVAVNLPGHGNSAGSGKDKISDYANELVKFIKETGIENPIPCGLSMGGAITLELLINNQKMFKGGIIINSGSRLRVMDAIFLSIKQDYEAYVKSTGSFVLSEKSDKNIFQPLLEKATEDNPDITYNDFAACNTFDVMDKLDSINSPVLIIAAKEDNNTPLKYSTFMNEKLKNSRLEIIEDAGHMTPMEKPEEVNDKIKEFISDI